MVSASRSTLAVVSQSQLHLTHLHARYIRLPRDPLMPSTCKDSSKSTLLDLEETCFVGYHLLHQRMHSMRTCLLANPVPFLHQQKILIVFTTLDDHNCITAREVSVPDLGKLRVRL